MHSKHLFFRLGLVNLALVAVLGCTMRLKILFEIPFLDYRNLLNAHSHFAFCGWVGLMLLTLFAHHLLPAEKRSRFTGLLLAVQASALGMLFTFPWTGYNGAAIVFSTAYVIVTFLYAAVYRSCCRGIAEPQSRRLMAWALVALLLSAAGPVVLGWMKAVHSTDTRLHRGAIYWYLHFQYNGFFTLGIFSHYLGRLAQAGRSGPGQKRFAQLLAYATIPTLFLSLLWNNSPLFYGIASVGVLLLLSALGAFVQVWRQPGALAPFKTRLARRLLRLSFASFFLKTLLQAGTLLPSLGNAVFGDRPVIIGFLHLVFLGFVSFYLLAQLAEEGYFNKRRQVAVYIFAAGVLANEGLLMLQGLGILLGTNSRLFEWGLLGAAATLLTGAAGMALAALRPKERPL